MQDIDPGTTFRGLPLTAEQDSEIRHYIHVRQRCGTPWDTSELQAMLDDMLSPPELSDEDGHALDDSMAAERAAALEQQDFGDDAPPSTHAS